MEDKSKICLIDDSVSGVGGTSLTLDAIMEPQRHRVDVRSTLDFSLKDVFSYDFFVLGNVLGFNQNSFDSIMMIMHEDKNFVKIEFDYGYCQYRGNIPHKILGGSNCDCPKDSPSNYLNEIYKKIRTQALHIFYMSQGQMEIHDKHLLDFPEEKKSVLSSCFTSDTLLMFKSLKKKNKNNKYAIIDGNGGWHTQAKGIEQSIKYAKDNNLEYDLIKTKTHKEMLNILSNYKALITLPIIDDTCPRITLEARYMGLEVITNEFSQHTTEDWWKDSDEKALAFTESRPKYFWEKIKYLQENV
tara:strand:- start:1599 stop:2498 length:900 start_codon:yes stop_codon:yes gene_type:complete